MHEKSRFSFIGYGLRVFLIILAGTVLSDALLYHFTDFNLGSSSYETMMLLRVAKVATLNFTFTVNIIVNILIFLAIFVTAILMSHRISGPMYRFGRVAENIAEGDLTTRAILRDNDFLIEQAERLDGAISTMRERLIDVRTGVAGMKEGVGKLSEGAGDAQTEREVIDGLSKLSGEINRELSYFRTGKDAQTS